MIRTLSELVETRSLETANHVMRVGEMARLLARHAGVDDKRRPCCAWRRPCTMWARWAYPTVSSTSRRLRPRGVRGDARPRRPRPRHPLQVGTTDHARGGAHRAAAPRALGRVRLSARVVGEEISLEGRITAIVDVFDALTSRRVYREARPAGEVRDDARGTRPAVRSGSTCSSLMPRSSRPWSATVPTRSSSAPAPIARWPSRDTQAWSRL